MFPPSSDTLSNVSLLILAVLRLFELFLKLVLRLSDLFLNAVALKNYRRLDDLLCFLSAFHKYSN